MRHSDTKDICLQMLSVLSKTMSVNQNSFVLASAEALTLKILNILDREIGE